MQLDKAKMLEIVRQQLALDMNCNEQDFLKDGIVFCEEKLNEGRRMFDRQNPYLEMATMGNGIVVSANAELLPKIKPVLERKSRDDLFFAPFLYGHSLYYIPDCKKIKRVPYPKEYRFYVKENSDIHSLYEIEGFNNAIIYDKNYPRPDVIVLYAMKGDKIVGMAGASMDSKTMWQIGIDVLQPYRKCGLATCLVTNLAVIIMERGIVPYYGTASSNIPSQSVAIRSGFFPAWMCTYKNIFDGSYPYSK